MRNVRLWRGLLGVDKRTVIEDIEFDQEGADGVQLVVARVRPRSGVSRRCGRCGRRAPWYDRGEGRRRWRGLDWGTVQVVLEADAPRVNCPAHGPTVVAVPWARHHAGHTFGFDDTVAWLAVACSKTAVCELMRIAWRTVGAIVARVWADVDKTVYRFANLRRIGIDEISYKRHHKYLTIVVDHDTGTLIWAAAGRDTKTLHRFFDVLGAERCTLIRTCPPTPRTGSPTWSPSGARPRSAVRIRFMWWPGPPRHSMPSGAEPGTTRGRWRAPSQTRPRPAPQEQRAPPAHERVRKLKGARYALWKNPEDLTERQTAKLAWIAKTDTRLYRAYLLKEGLRHVFSVKGEEGKQALDRWISWARRCRIPVFVELAGRIVRHRQAIDAALDHGLSQGLIESTNTKIRVLTRIAFGFHSAEALIALAMLALGGHRPALPGRA